MFVKEGVMPFTMLDSGFVTPNDSANCEKHALAFERFWESRSVSNGWRFEDLDELVDHALFTFGPSLTKWVMLQNHSQHWTNTHNLFVSEFIKRIMVGSCDHNPLLLKSVLMRAEGDFSSYRKTPLTPKLSVELTTKFMLKRLTDSEQSLMYLLHVLRVIH